MWLLERDSSRLSRKRKFSWSSKILYQPSWILASLFFNVFIDLDFDSVPHLRITPRTQFQDRNLQKAYHIPLCGSNPLPPHPPIKLYNNINPLISPPKSNREKLTILQGTLQFWTAFNFPVFYVSLQTLSPISAFFVIHQATRFTSFKR